MATNYFGTWVATTPIITGKGLLHGLMVSHSPDSSPHTLTLYDNTTATGTILMTISLSRYISPFYVMFPRRYSIPFTTGLSASYANCQLNIWATAL